MIEGTLPPETVAAIVEDARHKLAELQQERMWRARSRGRRTLAGRAP